MGEVTFGQALEYLQTLGTLGILVAIIWTGARGVWLFAATSERLIQAAEQSAALALASEKKRGDEYQKLCQDLLVLLPRATGVAKAALERAIVPPKE